MTANLKEKIAAALLKLHPEIGERYAKRYTDKYVDAVMEELALRFMMLSNEEIDAGEINFEANKVIKISGRCKTMGKTDYVYSLMKNHTSTALVIDTYTGNSITHRLSRVLINPLYKREVMEAIKSTLIEFDSTHLRELQKQPNKRVEIDPEAMASYIEQTRITLQRDDLQKGYEEKLIRNLQIANKLLDLAYEVEGVCYVDEYWEKIDSGRTHGHGLSLQRIPKEVRHAALGKCYRYDFKAASYALMTSLAQVIDPNIKTAALREYVKYRSVIRKRIADDVGISEDWVKGIFTALGFGAELKDNPYNEIRGLLGQEKFHKLLRNVEFTQIAAQLKIVSETILNERGKGDFEWLGQTYTETNPKDGKKRTSKQKLAWIYQCMESDALRKMVALIPKEYKIKLEVHDCVYLDRPLGLSVQQDIRYLLSKEYPLLNFEGEEIIPIHAAGYVRKSERDEMQRIAEHKKLIAVRERLAELIYRNKQFS